MCEIISFLFHSFLFDHCSTPPLSSVGFHNFDFSQYKKRISQQNSPGVLFDINFISVDSKHGQPYTRVCISGMCAFMWVRGRGFRLFLVYPSTTTTHVSTVGSWVIFSLCLFFWWRNSVQWTQPTSPVNTTTTSAIARGGKCCTCSPHFLDNQKPTYLPNHRRRHHHQTLLSLFSPIFPQPPAWQTITFCPFV